MIRKIIGEDAKTLIQSQISAHRGGIAHALSPFDAKSAFFAWFDTFRAIEEFINLPLFGLDDDALEQSIIKLRLDAIDPAALAQIRSALVKHFGDRFAQRFVSTVLQASAIGAAFRQHGLDGAAAGFQTVAHAIGYFQSRRRHLVALLYTLPKACRGRCPLPRLDTMNQFLPQVELSGLTLTGLYQKLMLAKVFPDFALLLDGHGFSANHDYEPLDAAFLDPERAGIMEMQAQMPDKSVLDRLESVEPGLIFSTAELRNNICLIEAAYAEFDLASSAFAPMANFIRDCLADCEDNYLIKLPANSFDKLVSNAGLTTVMRGQLVHRGGDYVVNTDVFAPFVELEGIFVSSVTLLSRFLYHWKTVCLNRVRRFQIRSGYILEKSVKAALAEQGFTVTDIKRINRKEFDVVAVLGKVIFNVQCKNNLVDLTRVETDAARFARYNRHLDRYYAAALAKEEAREQLLKNELGLAEVRHVVVSRFPVATTNPRIIPFGRIDRFRSIVGKP
jgi:hypothetical protein